ncbi:helix-turn-helix domain-containing protein [Streptomyces sp. NPDC021224]|uniref:helix-turn-helix domain-containing protein n=1 Tax=unclassified Streptomyces TaxID=2593676 RepID=UPI00379E923E
MTPSTTPSVVTLSNSALAAQDRFGWYVDVIQDRLAPLAMASPYARDFPAEIVHTDLGAAQLARFSFPALDATRTPRHIRRGGAEAYMLGLVHRSPIQVTQQRASVAVDRGGLVFFDMAYPLEAVFPDLAERSVVTVLQLPRASFPLPGDRMERLHARPVPTRGATGSLLRQLMGTALGQVADQTVAETLRLGTIAVDLAAAFLAGHLDAAGLLPADTRSRTLRARIEAFIEANLGDPGLTPGVIAARHHISVRTLHQVFGSEAESVMATVRRRRLERCRAALATPALRELPIGVLAARWGFSSAAEFSRVFKRTYGTTPRQFRNETAAARTSR